MTTDAQRPDLLIVGSVAFDSIETPSGGVERALGGSATFASIAASYFAKPGIVAVVGEDFDASSCAVLESRGVDVTGIETVKGGKTFHWKGRYHANMKDRDTLETCLNVFAGFDPRLPEGLRKSSYVFLANIGPDLQGRVLDQVETARFVGMDTMNLWISEATADLAQVLRRVDVLFLNDEESFQLTGEPLVLNAARAILALGPKFVVIKRGEYGALLFGETLCLYVPAVPLSNVVDPTGAGDAFAGGFMGSIAAAGEIDRASLARALRVGTAMASFACESFSVGALVGLDRTKIDGRLAFLQSMSA
jgi:sugar/nucleoside kinase (ribokinase family)